MKHNWEYKQFKDVGSILYGYPFDSEFFNSESKGMPLIRIRDVKPGYTSTFYKGSYSDEYVIKKGDLLVGMDGEFNIAPWQSYDALLNQRVCRIKSSNENIILSQFLYYFLGKELKRIEDITSFVTVKHLSAKVLNAINTPVPPLAEQERIVAELDALNGTIAKCRELLATLDSLAKSLFYDTFGDPVTNPKGWKICTLDEVSEKISNGANNKIEADTYKSEGILFFRCQNVWKNRFDLSDVVYIDEATNQKMKGSILKHNDLIVTKIGRLFTGNSSLGRVSLYEGEDGKANLSGNLSYIRLKDTVCPRFILYILISDYFRDYVRNTTSGGIDKRALNNSQLKALSIYLPPLALQKYFAQKIEAIEAEKKKIEATMAEVQTLLDSRMDYWFN